MRQFSGRNPRRGVAALWALMVLSVLALLLVAITRQAVLDHRALQRRENQMQAVWLARAGVELAAARLLSNPADYTGESLELLPGSQLRIQVRGERGSPGTFLVTVEARYPTDQPETGMHTLTRRFRRTVEKERVRIEGMADEAAAVAD